MKVLHPYLMILALVFSCLPISGKQEKTVPVKEIKVTAKDRSILKKVITNHTRKDSIGSLLTSIGKSFLNTPYLACTLEPNEAEKNTELLVINLREFDCTTFVETCLALARNIQSNHVGFNGYTFDLQTIRYRHGIRNGYPSRLHYFSEWLLDNEAKHILTLPARLIGIPFINQPGFMSSHPGSYICLKDNPENIAEIAKQEKIIASKQFYYIPKEKIRENEDRLQEGDIVGITTNIQGLDVAHTGLLTWVNGRIHLLHASSVAKKVIISEEPLVDYMAKNKSQTGIMIGRAINR